MSDLLAQRRALLLAPLLAALTLMRQAVASKLDPTKTMFTLPKDITWNTQPDWPQNSNAHADLFSNVNQPGLYYTLIRWYPGYMSAPHKICYRPTVRGAVRHVVDQQRRGFRPRELRAGASGNVRASRGGDVALRRRDRERQGAGGNRDLRHGAGAHRLRRAGQAGLAEGVIACAVTPFATSGGRGSDFP
jgi:hypothetical protein